MSIVTLVSGGLDSTLVALLTRETGIEQHPLFVDYGQRARDRELSACQRSMARLRLPAPKVAGLGGYGALVPSGLTNPRLHPVEDAFTPGRNMLFLLVGAAFAYQTGANAVSVGLLHQDTSIFPDQTSAFLEQAEGVLATCLARPLKVLAPLSTFRKRDVVALAKSKGIDGTYSCHLGGEAPCGTCIACREFQIEER